MRKFTIVNFSFLAMLGTAQGMSSVTPVSPLLWSTLISQLLEELMTSSSVAPGPPVVFSSCTHFRLFFFWFALLLTADSCF